MTGAQAIIASLEAEGVDTVFGYPEDKPSRSMTRSTILRRSGIFSLATSRVQRMRLMDMRVQRARRVS